MHLRSLLLCFLLFSAGIAYSQTIYLTGKVANEKNEALAGVSVKVTGNGGTSTSTDGRYQLALGAGRKYEITFSAVSYETKVINEIEVLKGGVNELNVTLRVLTKQEAGVVVTARTTQRKESVSSLIQFQRNTNTVASVISSEAIRRSPDRNTSDVLKRTPGASIQEGRFIVVRGLADRYNQAMLNGILLTSTEPDRKTFSFDLIPAPMIDNIVINKAFVPEYPGEWAGGLIQVNTKDIPAKSFFNIQLGAGYNTQSTGKTFYKDKGGDLDWFGIDDGTRGLPPGYTTKSNFDILSPEEKTAMGQQMRNAWAPVQTTAPLNVSFQANGGFTTKLFGKKLGGALGLIYNKSNRHLELLNRNNSISNGQVSVNYDYNDDRFEYDITAGALGSLALQLNAKNKVSLKSILNVNSRNSVTQRGGINVVRQSAPVIGSEFTFRQNTFFTSQLTGEHSLHSGVKLNWYGSFNILDGYSPDQRRILYSKEGSAAPYTAILSNTLSQESGSRTFQNLSDYIYTAGGDLGYSFYLLNQKQTIKGGYMFQVKDRLYDAKLFANYLFRDNNVLRQLPAGQIFSPENFGDGSDNKFGFSAIKGSTFRYMANTILNAGYLQFDNQIANDLRVVWGLRIENYDQLVGSVKKWDPRHTQTVVTDLLPGLNATLKLGGKTNLRLSVSQTVIRPELRELSSLNLYDFELNASVQGNPALKRTKVSNLDLRYEIYPRAGEVMTVGAFYKYFKNPIEQLFNEGSGGASTFSFQNPEKATSYGAEFEFRKKLDAINGFQNFTLQGNAAYIKSRVKDLGFSLDRPMQGQSPYLVNLGLMYDLEKYGLSATALLNRIGERIYLVGDISAGAGSPDIYEAPRSLLDLQMAKKLLHNRAELKLNISDLLNQTQYFYQNVNDKTTLQKGIDAFRFTRRFGTTYGLSFNYSL